MIGRMWFDKVFFPWKQRYGPPPAAITSLDGLPPEVRKGVIEIHKRQNGKKAEVVFKEGGKCEQSKHAPVFYALTVSFAP
jgi:hypothetical protein